MTPSPPTSEEVWTADECARFLRVPTKQFTRYTSKRPGFPARRVLGPRTFRWVAGEVRAWFDEQVEEPSALIKDVPAGAIGPAQPTGPMRRRRAA